jgi:NAD-dependent DNA ligase
MSAGSQKKKTTVKPQAKAPVLQGFSICFTGFNEEVYSKLARVANSLGAHVENVCSPKTSCLIAKYMGGRVCERAIKEGIPILSVKFLTEVQNADKLLPLENFLIPPLYKLCICATGLNAFDRKRLEDMVLSLGGSFSPDLMKNQITHLVAAEAKGLKYSYAKEWGNIKIISMKWIEECVALKRKCLGYVVVTEMRFNTWS